MRRASRNSGASFVQADFGPRLAADGRGENVVEMPVREQNVAQPLSAIPHGFQAGGGIVARVDDQGVLALWQENEVGVFLQFAAQNARDGLIPKTPFGYPAEWSLGRR